MGSVKHTVTIKIKPYLKDYLLHHFGPEPIEANMKNKFFPLLANYLTPAPKSFSGDPDQSSNTITFLLPSFSIYRDTRYKNWINPKYHGEIQSYFYAMFYMDFINYIDNVVIKQQIQRRIAILDFIQKNGISYDHATYETFAKIYFRYRNKLKKNRKKFARN